MVIPTPVPTVLPPIPSRGARALRTPVMGVLAAALLSACAVGPDHVRPAPPALADTFRDPGPATADVAGTETLASDAAFWSAFDDPLLDGLVADALAHNHDLQAALARYDQANALLRGARFDFLPTITVQGEAASTRSAADALPGTPRAARDADSYSAGVAASWELDVFGRVRRNVESGRAGAAAQAADLQALQVAIVGEVVSTYVELRGLQERLRVAQGNVDNQAETLSLVQARVDAGRGSEFDVARARAQLESTRALVPALDAQAGVAMHRLGVLTGQVPDTMVPDLSVAHPLPALPPRLDPDSPGGLLRRRPDVLAAEHRLHGATARIGVATADLFPRFTLSGLIGSQAIDSSALFERDSETRFVALGIDWSFLDIGRVRARIAASEAGADEALADYRRTVLLALEDAGNALLRYGRARTEDEHLGRAAQDSARAAELARIRFDAGAADLLEVLDAERTRLQAEDAFAQARARSVNGAVAVYRSFAGGWPQQLPERVAFGQR
ncbi:efflux transporter outer membrane subunit [Luteimonas abyssi]|uniref:efflux transporter outer membrane subunit n=1 Tax=Luteimonas abyssi TaxID=1247514 RepID=UPI0009E82936|nr:efflux transporter outer membrane subunit [Luteimonas abyssi]